MKSLQEIRDIEYVWGIFCEYRKGLIEDVETFWTIILKEDYYFKDGTCAKTFNSVDLLINFFYNEEVQFLP